MSTPHGELECRNNKTLGPRNLNKAVKCNPYYVRTIDHVISKVSGSTHFNILDALGGFWQVNLDEEDKKERESYLPLAGHLRNSTTLSLAKRSSLKQTISRCKAYGRRL